MPRTIFGPAFKARDSDVLSLDVFSPAEVEIPVIRRQGAPIQTRLRSDMRFRVPTMQNRLP